MEIKEDTFGTVKGRTVRRFTIKGRDGTEVQLINYGATITSVKVPDRHGKLDDVVLGFHDIEGYLSSENPYFGATVGRVSNRIGNGQFQLQGKIHKLATNNGPNHLHGGKEGFDKKMWDAYVTEDKKVVMSYMSADGEEGYPGIVLVHVIFELSVDNELVVEFKATSSKPTPLALTNHSYFNLSGHQHANRGMNTHYIQLNCDTYTPVDSNLLPTGDIVSVEGTPFDLRVAKDTVGSLLSKFPPGPNGYDNNFCINKRKGETFGLVAIVEDSSSGRVLMVSSDQPGVQFYTANFLPDPAEGKQGIVGKEKANYLKHGGFCLETQNYPNAVNMDKFPNSVLVPGDVYRHKVSYRFFATKIKG